MQKRRKKRILRLPTINLSLINKHSKIERLVSRRFLEKSRNC